MEMSIIQSTIDTKYHLKRLNRDWLLEANVKVRASNSGSFGFSLDKADKRLDPFGFFSDTPPEHIAKMCDAIIVQFYFENLYVVIIEQKSARKNQYRKQLANGRLFCEWLMNLYREHGYSNSNPTYIALLVWQPRTLPEKGGTTHRPVRLKQLASFDCLVEIQKQSLVQLSQILKTFKSSLSV